MNRRNYLVASASGTLVAVAGCLDDDDSDDSGDGATDNGTPADGAKSEPPDTLSYQYTGVTAGDELPSKGFVGATVVPDGRVVFAPGHAQEVGVFDPTAGENGEYRGVTSGDSIPAGRAFAGTALVPDGRVVFAPAIAGEVGVFDPSAGANGEYTSVTAGDAIPSTVSYLLDAFSGAAVAGDGRVVFAPANAREVGVFDPTAGANGEYTGVTAGGEIPSLDNSNRADNSFGAATVMQDGRVVFAPYNAREVGVFDPTAGDNGEYRGVTAGDDIPTDGFRGFSGAAMAGDGRVVFPPDLAGEVGVFDPTIGANGQYVGVNAGDPLPPLAAFAGPAVAPDGQLVFAPGTVTTDEVGVFDPSAGENGEYRGVAAGDDLPPTDGRFHGAATMPDGRVVFAPGSAQEVGVFGP